MFCRALAFSSNKSSNIFWYLMASPEGAVVAPGAAASVVVAAMSGCLLGLGSVGGVVVSVPLFSALSFLALAMAVVFKLSVSEMMVPFLALHI